MSEPSRPRRRLAAILMADVSGFSRMMGRDEVGTTQAIRAFHARVKARIEEFGGRVVDTAGDSVFGEFESVFNAVACAEDIQADQAESNAELSEDRHIQTRIGVHLGDVIVEDYKIYGDGVNIAARLEQIAEPGSIYVSEAVAQQVQGKLDVELQEVGLRELKNIEHPVRVFRVAGETLPAVVGGAGTDAALEDLHAGAIDDPEHDGGAEISVVDEVIRRPGWVAMLVIGGALLASEAVLFPTGGVAPTLGAVLTSIPIGLMLGVRGRRGGILLALGIGIASGAALTNWSPVTNGLFGLAGAVLFAIGGSLRLRGPGPTPPDG